MDWRDAHVWWADLVAPPNIRVFSTIKRGQNLTELTDWLNDEDQNSVQLHQPTEAQAEYRQEIIAPGVTPVFPSPSSLYKLRLQWVGRFLLSCCQSISYFQQGKNSQEVIKLSLPSLPLKFKSCCCNKQKVHINNLVSCPDNSDFNNNRKFLRVFFF